MGLDVAEGGGGGEEGKSAARRWGDPGKKVFAPALDQNGGMLVGIGLRAEGGCRPRRRLVLFRLSRYCPAAFLISASTPRS